MNEVELDFMNGLLSMDPTTRLTGEACLRHPYLRDLWEADVAKGVYTGASILQQVAGSSPQEPGTADNADEQPNASALDASEAVAWDAPTEAEGALSVPTDTAREASAVGHAADAMRASNGVPPEEGADAPGQSVVHESGPAPSGCDPGSKTTDSVHHEPPAADAIAAAATVSAGGSDAERTALVTNATAAPAASSDRDAASTSPHPDATLEPATDAAAAAVPSDADAASTAQEPDVMLLPAPCELHEDSQPATATTHTAGPQEDSTSVSTSQGDPDGRCEPATEATVLASQQESHSEDRPTSGSSQQHKEHETAQEPAGEVSAVMAGQEPEANAADAVVETAPTDTTTTQEEGSMGSPPSHTTQSEEVPQAHGSAQQDAATTGTTADTADNTTAPQDAIMHTEDGSVSAQNADHSAEHVDTSQSAVQHGSDEGAREPIDDGGPSAQHAEGQGGDGPSTEHDDGMGGDVLQASDAMHHAASAAVSVEA